MDAFQVRFAVVQALLVSAGALVLLSPLFRVHLMVWTGPIVPSEEICKQIEISTLGKPLCFVSRAQLRASAGNALGRTHVKLRRHFPRTLEIHLEPQHEVARLVDGRAVGRQGNILLFAEGDYRLPLLAGFELTPDSQQLSNKDRMLFVDLFHTLEETGLDVESVERRNDEIDLFIRSGHVRLRLRDQDVLQQLHKLKLFEQSLGILKLPANIDLRFRDQVVVQEKDWVVSQNGGS